MVKSESIKVLQKFLKSNNINVTVDGWFGNETVDGIHKLNVPNYIKIALLEVGVKEIVGGKHDKDVMKYHAVSGGFSTDEVPWCGSFVNWVMLQDGHTTVKFPARAKSWLKFGMSIDEPVIGAIAIKSRTGGGHVTFTLGKDIDTNKLYCLGGNQNNEANLSLYNKSDFIDFRVPINSVKLLALKSYKILGDTGVVREA